MRRMGRHRPTKIVGYLRTSTDDQLLGIKAQEARLAEIAEEKGCAVDRTYTEHESGGDNARGELDQAIRRARRMKAYLVVAKLDRLSRDQQFLMRLVDGNVPIIFGDLPDIDFTTAVGRANIQMLSMFAEFERRCISDRTRAALAILKRDGARLGASNPKCRNLTPEARKKGAASSAEKSVARAIDEQSDIAAIAAEMKAKGLSLRRIADHLNGEEYPTREGSVGTLQGRCRECRGWGTAGEPCPKCRPARTFDPGFRRRWKGGWSAVQVKRVLDRAAGIGPPAGPRREHPYFSQ
jgi:DNA invertase Pin-like site-specific DNA recombinase